MVVEEDSRDIGAIHSALRIALKIIRVFSQNAHNQLRLLINQLMSDAKPIERDIMMSILKQQQSPLKTSDIFDRLNL